MVINKPPVFLLADDDEDDRMLFFEALSEINPDIKCIMAKNGKEALIILQNDLFELPDYIFLDLNMPIVNGLQCLEEIKNSGPLKHIPVVVYSTSAEEELGKVSKKLGALDFFVKPSNFSGLLQYLRQILE